MHGVVRSTLERPLQTGGVGFSRHDIDDAPEGIIAVQGRTTAAHDFNALDIR